MGIDIRDIPADAAAALTERFREAGFDVELIVAPDPQGSRDYGDSSHLPASR